MNIASSAPEARKAALGGAAAGGADMPAPEPRSRRARIRVTAGFVLALSFAYLIWRTLFTVELGVWWLSVPLLGLEIHAFVSLAGFTFSLWDLDAQRPAGRVPPPGKVAVLIPTYDEPAEVLLPTVAAAVALQPDHETWVLDHGGRDEIERLAENLGARYLARPDRARATAGSINHALGKIDADFVAVLDADHVARPELLTNTLGYFLDPKVAVVQTPPDFYTLDSAEHQELGACGNRRARRRLYNEHALFHRAIQAGRNRWGAALWCGTGAVARVGALADVGGVSTEGILTTIRLHRKGWKSVFHNEVLARGIAAADAGKHQSQRLRWGDGARQVLGKENPLFGPGLSRGQRLDYAATLLRAFDSWRSLGYLLLPIATVVTGAVPIAARPVVFLTAFGTTFVARRMALSALGRGLAPPLPSTLIALMRMPVNIRAALGIFMGADTPAGRESDDRARHDSPLLLLSILAASAGAGLFFAATVLGMTPLHYGVPAATAAAACWMAFNAYFVARAIVRIRADRAASEQRARVRFDVRFHGTIDAVPCTIVDLSLAGARVELGPSLGKKLRPGTETHDLEFSVLGGDLRLDTIARSERVVAGRRVIGLEFLPGQQKSAARLSLALFNAHVMPQLEPAA